jgi:3-hydroxybutyryl-CoA dehydrogenase
MRSAIEPRAARAPGRPNGDFMKQIGVVGAGVMGVGVAQSAAQAGFEVVLVDIDEAVLARARDEIRNNLRYFSMMNRGAALDIPAVQRRITCTTDLDRLVDADFVVENVVEKCSAIPITRIGAATERPDRVLGMHFMNPVPQKDTVEVIRGFHTSADTLEIAQRLLVRLGKQAIVVNDSPGFVSNRVLMLTINEAVNLVQEGVASAADVDRLFESCFGHRMGPLATADLIGLDTILYSIEVLHDAFGDSKYRPSTLLRRMVDAGLHGRKSGRGFFDYALPGVVPGAARPLQRAPLAEASTLTIGT